MSTISRLFTFKCTPLFKFHVLSDLGKNASSDQRFASFNTGVHQLSDTQWKRQLSFLFSTLVSQILYRKRKTMCRSEHHKCAPAYNQPCMSHPWRKGGCHVPRYSLRGWLMIVFVLQRWLSLRNSALWSFSILKKPSVLLIMKSERSITAWQLSKNGTKNTPIV